MKIHDTVTYFLADGTATEFLSLMERKKLQTKE